MRCFSYGHSRRMEQAWYGNKTAGDRSTVDCVVVAMNLNSKTGLTNKNVSTLYW